MLRATSLNFFNFIFFCHTSLTFSFCRTYKVDPSSVVVLTGNTSNYDKGSEVMAMFPDTTSFYPASVVVCFFPFFFFPSEFLRKKNPQNFGINFFCFFREKLVIL